MTKQYYLICSTAKDYREFCKQNGLTSRQVVRVKSITDLEAVAANRIVVSSDNIKSNIYREWCRANTKFIIKLVKHFNST